MLTSTAIPIATLSGKTLAIFCGCTIAVTAPVALHGLGVSIGVGSALGQMFLPMFWPVLLVGLLAGRLPGLTVGMLSPLVSFALSGMPQVALLPPLMGQLAMLGLIAGVLASTLIPEVLKALIALGASIVVRILLHCSFSGTWSGAWNSVAVCWPGMVVLVTAIPIISHVFRRTHESN